MSAATKQLLVFVAAYQVMILVPKRRGEGFLKAPFGHHAGPLTQVEAKIGFDLWGLDGSLDVQTGYTSRSDKADLLARIIPPICAHYGMTYREVDHDEFWALHPLALEKKTKGDSE